jgi:hypothetical protein
MGKISAIPKGLAIVHVSGERDRQLKCRTQGDRDMKGMDHPVATALEKILPKLRYHPVASVSTSRCRQKSVL